MRALLDTNIILDLLCTRSYDEEALLQLRVMHAFSDVELWASAKSYTDLFYLIAKQIGSAKAHDLLEESFSWLHACSVEEADLKQAFSARWQDFENSLIHVCALKVGADFLITRDVNGFRNARIPCGSASAFMEYVYQEKGVRYSTDALR